MEERAILEASLNAILVLTTDSLTARTTVASEDMVVAGVVAAIVIIVIEIDTPETVKTEEGTTAEAGVIEIETEIDVGVTVVMASARV